MLRREGRPSPGEYSLFLRTCLPVYLQGDSWDRVGLPLTPSRRAASERLLTAHPALCHQTRSGLLSNHHALSLGGAQGHTEGPSAALPQRREAPDRWPGTSSGQRGELQATQWPWGHSPDPSRDPSVLLSRGKTSQFINPALGLNSSAVRWLGPFPVCACTPHDRQLTTCPV